MGHDDGELEILQFETNRVARVDSMVVETSSMETELADTEGGGFEPLKASCPECGTLIYDSEDSNPVKGRLVKFQDHGGEYGPDLTRYEVECPKCGTISYFDEIS